jgi:hypothetical protein
MKRIILALAIFCTLFQGARAQRTVVAATKITDGSGNLLFTGQWCFGSTCFPVLNGSVPLGSFVTPGTATITVSNGPITFLILPNVSIAGSLFPWDAYTVPSNGNIFGMGVPRLACTPGALYTQTDATPYLQTDGAPQIKIHWECQGINWAATWVAHPTEVRLTGVL